MVESTGWNCVKRWVIGQRAKRPFFKLAASPPNRYLCFQNEHMYEHCCCRGGETSAANL